MKESATVKRRKQKHKYENGSDSLKNNNANARKSATECKLKSNRTQRCPPKVLALKSGEQKKFDIISVAHKRTLYSRMNLIKM